ncbi:MAG: tetratricopeptide repeat protein [Alistipes sp.]|nr:tetratricopeptide repeat protein [Alistipes sp.]
MKKMILSLIALAGVATVWAQDGVAKAYTNGAAKMSEKNYAEAVVLLEQVVDEGMTSEDATVLQQVENAKKYVVTCYRSMGMAAAKAGDFDLAISNLEKAIERASEYGNAQDKEKANQMLASVYQAQGGKAYNDKDWATAAAIFEKGYAANPRNTKMANWLGTSYCEMGEFDKGIEILSAVAANTAPRAAEDAAEAKRLVALYYKNHVAGLQGDNNFDQIIELGETAAAAQQTEEDRSDVYFILAAAYSAKEQPQQAVAAMQKVTAGDNVAAAKAAIAELSK